MKCNLNRSMANIMNIVITYVLTDNVTVKLLVSKHEIEVITLIRIEIRLKMQAAK